MQKWLQQDGNIAIEASSTALSWCTNKISGKDFYYSYGWQLLTAPIVYVSYPSHAHNQSSFASCLLSYDSGLVQVYAT